MKRLNLLTILAMTFAVSTSAMAGDVADIKATMKEHFMTMNAGDAAGHIAHHKARNSSFGTDGGALTVNESLDQETADM